VLHAHLGGTTAVPLDEGEARLVGVVGGTLVIEHFDVGLELQVPFVGDPFTVRGVLSAGYRG
jgi:hypothetical protein